MLYLVLLSQKFFFEKSIFILNKFGIKTKNYLIKNNKFLYEIILSKK
jgi:hypothetical protein